MVPAEFPSINKGRGGSCTKSNAYYLYILLVLPFKNKIIIYDIDAISLYADDEEGGGVEVGC